jgi:hypothetical protein
MGPGLFSVLGSGSDLEVVVGVNIGDGSAVVKICRPFEEVLFHHVKELGVLLLVDSWVFDDKTAVLFEGLSDSFTILRDGLALEERFDVDDWDFETGETGDDFCKDSLQHVNFNK